MNENKNEQEMIRMVRTINGAVEEIKKIDPETPINADMLRRWIISGKLKHTKSGNKYLIDMEVLKEFLKGE
ncbi:MAG: helix-turn-helix domain-containing protein [Clostridiales bacterium]|nr:helix-turn-helix domain-containing protein [Clostridiales bacterium]